MPKPDLWSLGLAALWGKTGDLIVDAQGRTYQVEWFNRKRGFGFLRDVGTGRNIFIHLWTLIRVEEERRRVG